MVDRDERGALRNAARASAAGRGGAARQDGYGYGAVAQTEAPSLVDKDGEEEDARQALLSAWCALTKSLLCATALSLSWSYQASGWLLGSLLTVLVGAVSAESMTVVLQVKTALQARGAAHTELTYSTISALVLGQPLRFILPVATIVSCMLACAGYLSFMANLAQILFPQLSSHKFIAICAVLLMVGSRLEDWSSGLALASGVGTVGFVLAVCLVLYEGVRVTSSSIFSQAFSMDNMFRGDWQLTIGPIIFMYTLTYVVLPMHAGSHRPDVFPRAIAFSMAFCLFASVTLGSVGFLAFGNASLIRDSSGDIVAGCEQPVCENILMNVGTNALKAIASGCLIVDLCATYLVLLAPAREIIEPALIHTFLRCTGGVVHSLASVGIRVKLVIITALLAAFCPHFALLIGLVGSLTDALQCFVIPSLIFLRVTSAAFTPILDARIACAGRLGGGGCGGGSGSKHEGANETVCQTYLATTVNAVTDREAAIDSLDEKSANGSHQPLIHASLGRRLVHVCVFVMGLGVMTFVAGNSIQAILTESSASARSL